MAVNVVFTPDDAAPAAVGIVVDVLRATSTIAQALASGYERVLCCAEIDEARALRASTPDSLLGGERNAVRIEGFDGGARRACVPGRGRRAQRAHVRAAGARGGHRVLRPRGHARRRPAPRRDGG